MSTRGLSRMMTEDPWAGLAAGEARRMSASIAHDLFWIRLGRSEFGIAFLIPDDATALPRLPTVRNLDIRVRELDEGRGLVIELRDSALIDVFVVLCRDIMTTVAEVESHADALEIAVRRALRWHHLLRGGTADRLSPEEQRGLVAELHFLRLLVDRIGPRAAIEAWRGPLGAAKDFEMPAACIEVKARRGAARPEVRISSEDQLSDVEGLALFLRVSDVDLGRPDEPATLTHHVTETEALFRDADPVAFLLWETAIGATGYDPRHDYSDRTWHLARSRTHAVRDGFPRITRPIAVGVSRVTYAIALDACRDFLIDDDTFWSTLLDQGG